MMKIKRNRLKKCWTATQMGRPGRRAAPGGTTVPGYVAMNRCTDIIFRKPLAAATEAIKTTRPIGSNQSRLNHLRRPTRTRGATPPACGTEPAHVAGSMTSSPAVSCDRKDPDVPVPISPVFRSARMPRCRGLEQNTPNVEAITEKTVRWPRPPLAGCGRLAGVARAVCW